MVIAVDLTSLAYHITGIERYALCITEEMLKIDRENNYILIFKEEIYPVFCPFIDGERVKAKLINCRSKVLLFQVVLPLALYGIRADRYLFLAFPGPILFRRRGIFSAIHDMGAWDAAYAFTGLQKIYCRAAIVCGAAHAEGIITVSEFSKGRISKILRCDPDKIHVIYSAVTGRMHTDELSFEEVKTKYGLPDRYIMALSTFEPKKNLEFLLEIYSRIAEQVDYELVLVGRTGWKIEETLKKYSGRNKIHMTGFVEDEAVAQIYRHALCFVFPSKYEGFGLPPVEALSFGTPVLASDAASIPEVLMQQARYFDCSKEEELKSCLIDLVDLCQTMPRELNEYQKKNFTFMVSAQKVLDVMK